MQLELARRCASANSRIAVNGCAPGYVVTDIDKIVKKWRRRRIRCLKCCFGPCCACCDKGKDLDNGTATLLWLGVSEEAAGISGEMWYEMQEKVRDSVLKLMNSAFKVMDFVMIMMDL